MKRCKNCQAMQENDAVFCMECGYTEFEEVVTSQPTEEKENDTQTAVNDDDSSGSKEDIKSEGKTPETSEKTSQPLKTSPTIQLIMLDENETPVKSWTLGKLPSYSVGRISSKGSVDIDLSDFEAGKYVSRNHAKIYRADGKWYYSDLDSKYGTEIITKKRRETAVPKESYLLEKGMILVLAKKVRFEVR